ncbi:HaeIII family restriction endonuclease [Bacillus velezensis]|uniref:HaeIII family restriction endonuclease n=1 Tax=Bacillus velezensis TaxID=492670 RepID=UPI0007F8CA92|nr:HaeIII family restriction endonuclease [Bacillus velezensis]AYV17556.1 HaeIII family restriction endonuclease [Bacillus velezensis]MCG1015730.1 HaeIII family restriction endonuclease [Bacillus velezensis]MCR6607270.1 HaeIII family restriction endonuclease [Bacillus velezensis]MCT6680862.1 HaeIII family restriction endonuclease [Bacillus velezensis]MCV2523428.1 HaeIII family restriction endonuclease [Bacillus velezensis]
MGIQTRNGKALEYAFLQSLSNSLCTEQIQILDSDQLTTARDAYLAFDSEKIDDMNKASMAGVMEILKLEPGLLNGEGLLSLAIQQDSKGQTGDVRDVLAMRGFEKWEIGLSCKKDHKAVKHSRLSASIDVGESWFGFKSTDEYFKNIIPLFKELDELKQKGLFWRELENKSENFYKPVLEALNNELKVLDGMYPGEIPKRLLSYLLGRHDFYKAIVDTKNKTTEIQAFNLYGTLNKIIHGNRPKLRVPQLKLPKRFYDIHFKEGSNTTLIIVCDEGWTISARIHNASSKVESSLKLDVQIAGLPPTLYRQVVSWN